MSLLNDAKQALEDAGKQLKADLWKPDDAKFLEARAKDIVGLAAKASEEQNPAKKAGYIAAARDTLVSVKLLALIRMETGEKHLLDALGNFFMSVVIPAVLKALPALVGL
jgi:hypothetical protein